MMKLGGTIFSESLYTDSKSVHGRDFFCEVLPASFANMGSDVTEVHPGISVEEW